MRGARIPRWSSDPTGRDDVSRRSPAHLWSVRYFVCRRAGPVGDQMGNVMIRAGRGTNAHRRPGRIATASFSAVVIGFAAALTMLYYGGTAHGADDVGAGAGIRSMGSPISEAMMSLRRSCSTPMMAATPTQAMAMAMATATVEATETATVDRRFTADVLQNPSQNVESRRRFLIR